MLSDFKDAIAQLLEQRAGIDQALEILRSLNGDGATAHAPAQNKRVGTTTTTAKKRVMSSEARIRIAEAQKKRWAAVRKAKRGV